MEVDTEEEEPVPKRRTSRRNQVPKEEDKEEEECETSESINSRRNFGVIGVRRINRVGVVTLGRTGIRSPVLSLSSTGPLYTCN